MLPNNEMDSALLATPKQGLVQHSSMCRLSVSMARRLPFGVASGFFLIQRNVGILYLLNSLSRDYGWTGGSRLNLAINGVAQLTRSICGP